MQRETLLRLRKNGENNLNDSNETIRLYSEVIRDLADSHLEALDLIASTTVE
jgi:hypothetical protein